MPSNALPPLFQNTARDHGAQPVVLGYIGASITILAAIIRLMLTIKKSHGFSIDDYFFLGAAIIAVATSVTLERSVDEGLGRHSDALTLQQLDSYTKLTYSTGLLSVFAQACAKLSVAFLYERIAPRQDKKGITILLSCIGVWIVLALFGTAFACEGKVYWQAKCHSGGWVEFPIVICNLITDAMLSVWMVPKLYRLQAKARDRILPIMLMASRLLVCAVELALLVWLANSRSKVSYQNEDSTWTFTTGFTLGISVVHLSVITATIPRINSFLADVQTRRAGLALTQADYDSYKNSKSGSNSGSKGASRSRNSTPLSPFRKDPQARLTTSVQGNRGEEIEMDVRDNVETGSQSSLQRNAVYQVYQKTDISWSEERATDRKPAHSYRF